MRLKACLNGARLPAEHPALPVTPDELAADAVRAVAGGTPLGVTTGAWSIPDPTERVQAIRAWTVLPDFASVNWHEPGAEQVAGALVSLGVGIEAGLWHGESVADWLTSPYRDRCLRALIELPDGLDGTETVARAELLLAQVRTADVQPQRCGMPGSAGTGRSDRSGGRAPPARRLPCPRQRRARTSSAESAQPPIQLRRTPLRRTASDTHPL